MTTAIEVTGQPQPVQFGGVHAPKLFQPMPDEVFRRTPPHLRVMYMVKRVLNQSRKRAGLDLIK